MDKKEYLCLNFQDGFLRLDITNIVYIKSVNHKACIVLCDMTEETVPFDIFQVRTTIVENFKESASAFVFVEDFIVNINYIHRIDVTNQKLVMSDGGTFAYQLKISKESLSKLKEKCVSFTNVQDLAQSSSDMAKTTKQTLHEQESNLINGHECVDLGLSVKWATCNVGASSPWDFGDYYAWGEIQTKSDYTEENSVTSGMGMRDIAGNPKYDAARAKWGDPWRLPTKDEIDELFEECKRTLTKQKGRAGYLMFGPNGNSIFLPATGMRLGTLVCNAGEGHYWASTPYDADADTACSLMFYGDYFASDGDRWYRENGFSIRPVSE